MFGNSKIKTNVLLCFLHLSKEAVQSILNSIQRI